MNDQLLLSKWKVVLEYEIDGKKIPEQFHLEVCSKLEEIENTNTNHPHLIKEEIISMMKNYLL
jgi:hypothetical protein